MLTINLDVPDATQYTGHSEHDVTTEYIFQVVDAYEPTISTEGRRDQIAEDRRWTKRWMAYTAYIPAAWCPRVVDAAQANSPSNRAPIDRCTGRAQWGTGTCPR